MINYIMTSLLRHRQPWITFGRDYCTYTQRKCMFIVMFISLVKIQVLFIFVFFHHSVSRIADTFAQINFRECFTVLFKTFRIWTSLESNLHTVEHFLSGFPSCFRGLQHPCQGSVTFKGPASRSTWLPLLHICGNIRFLSFRKIIFWHF